MSAIKSYYRFLDTSLFNVPMTQVFPGMFLIDTVDTSGDDVSRYVRKSVSVLVISVTPIDLGFASRWQVQTLEA